MKERNQEDRKFLHDLATPLTVLKAMVTNIGKDMAKEDGSIDKATILNRVAKAREAIALIEDLHAKQKEVIFDREGKDK